MLKTVEKSELTDYRPTKLIKKEKTGLKVGHKLALKGNVWETTIYYSPQMMRQKFSADSCSGVVKLYKTEAFKSFENAVAGQLPKVPGGISAAVSISLVLTSPKGFYDLNLTDFVQILVDRNFILRSNQIVTIDIKLVQHKWEEAILDMKVVKIKTPKK